MSIEAMKQALEALEVEQGAHAYLQLGKADHIEDAITTLRTAIAEAEKQEPVVWMYQDKSTHEVRFQKHIRDFVDHGATYETPLYTTPPAAQSAAPTGFDAEFLSKRLARAAIAATKGEA